MSTKNLARTIIEGGRRRASRDYRRQTLREHRAAERALLQRLRADGDDGVCFARRQAAYKDFRDKLSPALRWLQRQVGRPWDLVRGELLALFDTRTTPGRHIVFDHMLRWVEGNVPREREFTVDAHGLLRRTPRVRYSRRRRRAPLPRPRAELDRWLAGRRVVERGDTLFWLTPTPSGAYRQDRRLTDDDAALWRSLPAWFRVEHRPDAPPTADRNP